MTLSIEPVRAPTYRLARRVAPAAVALDLDAEQRSVLAHPGGPLLVLAGPGTGKTTTLVEAVVDRIAHRGLDPEHVLVLTFSRKAAAELRDRITARLGGTTREPVARTFHSYAFALLRREAALRGAPPPRLLSGPEQDLVVRELLRGDVDSAAPGWPERLRPALTTRGFARELRDLLLRAVERGVDADALYALGRAQDRDDWQAAARFLRQYSGVTALADASAYDPAELLRAVIDLFGRDPELLARERAQRRAVFVDEYQDTDPAQEELLQLLAGGGRDLVVVGDPDQSIYGFRGTDVRGIREFPQRFPDVAGRPAQVVRLHTSWRCGSALIETATRVARRLPGPVGARERIAADGVPAGNVEVHVLRSRSQEAAFLAHRLRQAHLLDGVPWSRMAILVRSTISTLPVLRRSLMAAGVPVWVHGEEVPLVDQPAVRSMLQLLRCAVRPETLDEETAHDLLLSSFGGADALTLRRLRQELRRLELVAGGRRASGALLVEAMLSPVELTLVPTRVARPAERVADLLVVARDAAAAPGATAEDVLWAVWARSGLAVRWQRESLRGDTAGAAADRDLDAVVALFDSASRFVDRLPGAGPDVFLDFLADQQIPSDTLAPRAPAGEAVAIVTAHASKGLEWDVVAVAGVQEGSWPDLRLRGSFLGSEHLVDVLGGAVGEPGPTGTLQRLLAEERRLFYVAVTRARRRLLVTAVESEREGEQPSRFLDEIDPLDADDDLQHRRITVVPRALSLPALVAELRSVAVDPGVEPHRRTSAAGYLAELATAGARGADPSSWYGLVPLSDDSPVRDPEQQVAVSPSKVESFQRCQLRWFLEHVGGTEQSSSQQSLGTLVHALAADPALPDEAAMLRQLEVGLDRLDLGPPWHAERRREEARTMVRRLAAWLRSGDRELVAAELAFEETVGRAALVGRVDRLERDGDGRGVVVDLKTGSRPAPDAELAAHPQLAVYQLAIEVGAFRDQGLTEPGGAELVQVGGGAKGGQARVQAQPPLSTYADPRWAQQLVEQVAEGMAGATFHAVDNSYCRKCPVRSSCPLHEDGRQVGA